MISYDYQKDSFDTFQKGASMEWALTNGIGGYAGSSLIGAHTRTHQGYLIASLHPPIERYMVFSKINESVIFSENKASCTASAESPIYSLETSQHLKNGEVCYTEGQRYLNHFSYDGSIHYDYQVMDVNIKKHITLKQGANLCAVAYELTNAGDTDAVFQLVPLFNFREHNTLSVKEDLCFDVDSKGHTLRLIPKSHEETSIQFQISEGEFAPTPDSFDCDMQLRIEVELETEGLDCHYCPVQIPISLPAGCTKKVSVLCSVDTADTFLPDISADAAFTLLEERAAYTKALLLTTGCSDPENSPVPSTGSADISPDAKLLAARLTLASDQFLCHRNSTGLKTVLAGLPWFTDWGRDTMIAFTGLTLCTGRFEDAREILVTFARYIKNGIVPNMFPDDNAAPLYNTADASLWYFYAVWQYLNYVNTPEAEAFVKDELYPHLTEILHAYRKGTDFSIFMDDDCLMHAGSGLDQITWMDVRVGDWVATPRHGKPVEINALWYNALKVMEALTERFYGAEGRPSVQISEDAFSAADYRALSERVKSSFCEKFWNPKKGCLHDVIGDDDTPDDSLRPNQIYAVSLPFTMLSAEQEKSIVDVVERELYVGCGLRSLSRDHKDYHPIYCGSLPKRDAAYHQGTAWGFLLGGFLSAYLKVHDHSKESISHALTLLEPVHAHLTGSGCIGSISEIFDGDAPHNPRGCYAQAWSVGEVLRAYTEDILPYLSGNAKS